MKINRVKDIKKLIDQVMLPGYSYKTNFNSKEFLVKIRDSLVIAAKLVKKDNTMEYEFILDTQFLYCNEIKLDELKMISDIMNILECNRNFVLSRLKKYTVEEYEKEQFERNKESDEIFEFLKSCVQVKGNL